MAEAWIEKLNKQYAPTKTTPPPKPAAAPSFIQKLNQTYKPAPKPVPAPAPKTVASPTISKPNEDRIEHSDPTGPAGQDWARKIGNMAKKAINAFGEASGNVIEGTNKAIGDAAKKFPKQMVESTKLVAESGSKALGQTLKPAEQVMTYAPRIARAGSALAATPFAYLMGKGEVDAGQLAEQQKQTAMDILMGK